MVFIQCDQEAKATTTFKAQIDKLQKERDEFQKMVIGSQVNILELFMTLCSYCCSFHAILSFDIP